VQLENFSQRVCIYVNMLLFYYIVLASEMLLLSFLLASSLCVLVILQVATRLPLVLLTLKLRRLLTAAVNALNILQGFRILRIA
jgi:hypothetical protein